MRSKFSKTATLLFLIVSTYGLISSLMMLIIDLSSFLEFLIMLVFFIIAVISFHKNFDQDDQK